VDGACPSGVVLELHDDTGALIAVGSADETGCPVLDATRIPGAQALAEGDYALCLRSTLGVEVPAYALQISPIPVDETPPVDEDDDDDGDGAHNSCDADRDGDGIDNEEDDCPRLSNGPDTPLRGTNDEGFWTTWMTIGPLTGNGASPNGCLPSETESFDVATELPELGVEVGARSWVARLIGNERFNLHQIGRPDPPREVYVATWATFDEAQDITLAFGLDDGARVWWNGEEVLEVTGCQGTNRDQFTVPVTALAGENGLVVKVHDQGGGWGIIARALDDAGDPVTDITFSLIPGSTEGPRQRDTDGDGVGDYCDGAP
jgi:hypothetical protein